MKIGWEKRDTFMYGHSPKGHLKYEFNNGVHFLGLWPINRDCHNCTIASFFIKVSYNPVLKVNP